MNENNLILCRSTTNNKNDGKRGEKENVSRQIRKNGSNFMILLSEKERGKTFIFSCCFCLQLQCVL